jgi:tetratricopeptide (TPR) repeat protein
VGVLALVAAGGGVGAWAVWGGSTPTPAAAAIPTASAIPTATPTANPTANPAANPAATTTESPGETARPPAVRPHPVVPRDPQLARALYDEAEEKRRALDTPVAARLYERALVADPGLREAHKKLGQCYQMLGQTEEARAHYQKYLDAHPPDAERIRAVLGTLR